MATETNVKTGSGPHPLIQSILEAHGAPKPRVTHPDIADGIRYIAAHEADPRKEELLYEAADLLEWYETSGERAEQPRDCTERLPDNHHERDCEYVMSDGPAPCTCGYYDREQSAIEARNP